ncbi:hypothetical protein F443_22571 [Phytophthora nicotianae P1569]|uniref:Uncharacterized protein n=2 Tax=Phytophthora nicotianae TaxID=4792 RepID=V9DTX1_PHYNI|nr:hypothetical protein F443_22571 [Phytophthora nicotianae P1569]
MARGHFEPQKDKDGCKFERLHGYSLPDVDQAACVPGYTEVLWIQCMWRRQRRRQRVATQ